MLAAWALMMTAAAAAQDTGGARPVPLVDLSAGYMFMHEEQGGGFPGGWYASVGANPWQWLGFVGEVSGSHKTIHEPFDGGSHGASVYTFLAGGRVFHRTGRVVPFAQVLTGLARREMSSATVNNFFTIQPGAGVTVLLTERVGIRAAGDYRALVDYSDDYTYNQYRLTAGVSLHR